MKYHHIGIPTEEVRKNEVYLQKFKVFCTDHESNPYGIQWMRYEPDSPLPDIVKKVTHIAFEVENLEEAIQDKQVIIPPNSPSEGVLVAFIIQDGAPVEFIQIDRKKRPE